MQAALKGARQIGFTVISISLSLVAVFIPLLFMSGLIGQFVRRVRRNTERSHPGFWRGFVDPHADALRPDS